MSNENETRDTDGDADETRLRNVLREGLGLNRRDVMKVAGGVGILASAGKATASEHTCDNYDGLCDTCGYDGCRADRGSCTHCIDSECEEVPDSRLEAPDDFDEDQQCVTVDAADIPPEATHAAIKAANECHECVVHHDASNEGQTFCVNSDHDISHIEFADCPVPRVTDLSANCDTLTIETEDAVGDTITVDYRLLLDGSEVVDPDPVSITDDDDDGVYQVDLTGDTDDSYKQVEVESITHDESGRDMLAEGGFSAPVTLETGELCNPPSVTEFAANCDELAITTEHAAGDSITVDFRLLYDGTEVVDPAAVTVADGDDGSDDGVYHVDVGPETYTQDTWNQVEVVSITHNETGEDMLAVNFTPPVTLDTEELCNPPTITDLAADCDTLTVTTEHAVGDSITVDFRLLYDGTEVVDPADVTVADADDGTEDGVYEVDLTGYTTDSYNQVEVESVTHDGTGTDMLAEGEVADADRLLSTGKLCNPPAVTDLAADCDGLTITTEHAVGDSITVDFRLLYEGSEVVNPAAVTVADADDGSADGVYHVDLTGYTTDSYNQVEVVSVTHDETGEDMLATNFDAPVTVGTGELCNPPEVENLATNCDTIFIEVNDAAAGDELSVDFTLDEIDETGSLVANNVVAQSDVSTTSDSDNVATVTIDDFTASSDLWNVVDITEIEHVDTGTQMLDDSVRELVVVNRTL